MPLFSVIIPVYNAEKTIERCVESICQSGKDLVEIILVDDCSKDESFSKCLKIAEKYKQVKVFKNDKNKGVSYTRNRAIDNAKGEYLLFVDSDDYVAEEYVDTFLRLVNAGKTFAVCGYYNHDEKYAGKCTTIVWNYEESNHTYPLTEIIKQLQERTLLQQLWNKVFITRWVKEKQIRFDESINIGEDTRFILEYIQKNGIKEITCVNMPLYHYMRDNDGSLMYKVGYESVEEPLKNLRTLYQIMGHSDVEIEEKIRQDRERQVQLYAYLIMHNAGMKMRERKRLIIGLDKTQGKLLYRKQYILYLKEKIGKFLRG